MGLLICKDHSETGPMPYLSKDLADNISSRIYVAPSNIKSVHVIFNDDGECLFDRYYFFSKEMYESLSLEGAYTINTDQEEIDFKKMLEGNLGIVCVDCFKEYMERIGYKYSM